MNFLSRMLRFLFWVLVLSWSVRLLRSLVNWMIRGATTPDSGRQAADVAGASQPSGVTRRLVRDPMCGVHVAEAMAIPLREGEQTLHFCSATCRDQYVATMTEKKIAASGCG
jgi:YHS domain-containing protein